MTESPRVNRRFYFSISIWSKFSKYLLSHFHKNFLSLKIFSFLLIFLLYLKTRELQTMFAFLLRS